MKSESLWLAGCTFEIAAFLRDSSAVDVNEWVDESGVQGSQKLTTLVPIKSSATPFLKMQLHVETL